MFYVPFSLQVTGIALLVVLGLAFVGFMVAKLIAKKSNDSSSDRILENEQLSEYDQQEDELKPSNQTMQVPIPNYGGPCDFEHERDDSSRVSISPSSFQHFHERHEQEDSSHIPISLALSQEFSREHKVAQSCGSLQPALIDPHFEGNKRDYRIPGSHFEGNERGHSSHDLNSFHDFGVGNGHGHSSYNGDPHHYRSFDYSHHLNSAHHHSCLVC